MISTFALVIIAAVQVAFIVATLMLLAAVHNRGTRGDAADEAASLLLREPVLALVMGTDRGESLAGALSKLDPVIATRQLVRISASQLGPEQRHALGALLRPMPWVTATLAGGRSRRWWKRMEAARMLAVVSAPSDAGLLARLVCDSHPAVASAATAAIASGADDALVGAIVRGLSRQPATIRLQQIRALRAHPEVATGAVVAGLAAESAPEQLRALIELAEVLETPEALAAVLPCTVHTDAEVRMTAARALRSCFMPAGVEAARRLLHDTDWRVRAAGARALAALNVVDAVPELQAALRDSEWWVRFRAALALGSLGETGATALAAATADDDSYARDMAVVVSQLSPSARLELNG